MAPVARDDRSFFVDPLRRRGMMGGAAAPRQSLLAAGAAHSVPVSVSIITSSAAERAFQVGALDAVLNALESQPWSVRRRFTVRRDGQSATIQRGGMQAAVREVDSSAVEVIYEHALHEVTRVRANPEVAARLLLAVIQRERLTRVEVPDAEPSAAPDPARN